jgi:hypothetical protein
MARTITEIKNIIITAKNNEAALAGLTSTSATAIFNLWAYVVAVAIWTLEVIFDTHKTEIDNKIASSRNWNVIWFYEQCLLWQYGDSLSWVIDKFSYSTIDLTKRIIKLVAVVEQTNGSILIKVAKDNGVILNVNELSAFEIYIKKIKIPGMNVQVISYEADQIKFDLNITYNSQLMTSTGQLISDNSYPVIDAITEYLKGIKYGGTFNKTKCIDAIQAATGVVDVWFTSVEAKAHNAVSYTTVTGQNYSAIAGNYEFIQNLSNLIYTADV